MRAGKAVRGRAGRQLYPKMVAIFLALHFLDFLTTFYAIHLNNPYGVIEEKNIMVKHVVESSPLSFSLLYALTNLYFIMVFQLFKWLEHKVKRQVVPIVLSLLIITKNNFHIILFILFW